MPKIRKRVIRSAKRFGKKHFPTIKKYANKQVRIHGPRLKKYGQRQGQRLVKRGTKYLDDLIEGQLEKIGA